MPISVVNNVRCTKETPNDWQHYVNDKVSSVTSAAKKMMSGQYCIVVWSIVTSLAILILMACQTLQMWHTIAHPQPTRILFTPDIEKTAFPHWSINQTVRNFRKKFYIHNNRAETRAPRLGNQLFFYACLFGIGWRSPNHTPLWPDSKNSYLRNAFKLLRIPVDKDNAILSSSDFKPAILKVGAIGYSNSTEKLPESNVTIDGHVHTGKYFAQVEDQLRRDLTFNADIIYQARRFINVSTPHDWNATTRGDFVRVVIHVRRTDYAPKTERQIATYGFPVPTNDYFNRSITFFEKRFRHVLFVVLSDDVDWCRKNVAGGRSNVVFSQGNSPYIDLAIASLCDHAIVTLGSFGWWAAWFANGITITLRFCSKYPPSADMYNLKEFYKPEWLGFEQC